MLVLIVLLSYFGYKLDILINKKDNALSKKTFYKDLDKSTEEPYDLIKLNFDFAVNVSSWSNIPFTPDIGSLEVSQVIFTYDDNTGSNHSFCKEF